LRPVEDRTIDVTRARIARAIGFIDARWMVSISASRSSATRNSWSQLIVCGSSNSDMKTYPEWERVVLEHTYDAVDHISLHMYFANRAKNTANYLALNEKLDAYIGAIASTIELVRASKRSRKKARKEQD